MPAATSGDPAALCVRKGCTSPASPSYDPAATSDDGSCAVIFGGCTASAASNYDDEANADDGSCYLVGCTDPDATKPFSQRFCECVNEVAAMDSVREQKVISDEERVKNKLLELGGARPPAGDGYLHELAHCELAPKVSEEKIQQEREARLQKWEAQLQKREALLPGVCRSRSCRVSGTRAVRHLQPRGCPRLRPRSSTIFPSDCIGRSSPWAEECPWRRVR